MTPAEVQALKIAEQLIDAGIPVFSAAPNPDKPGHYYLPKEWEKTTPSRIYLERWRPGHALAAVGGHVGDFLDFDPRNGGAESKRELEIQGQLPRAFGVQSTPSGGTHLLISPTGERKSTGFMPGVDLQAGNAAGVGRGFVYIAPTVRPSKAPETLNQLRPYVWVEPPDLDYLKDFAGPDDSLEGIVARVHAARKDRVAPGCTPGQDGLHGLQGGSSAYSQLFTNGARTPFTLEQAQEFCLPVLEALERAEIGSIEDRCNDAAVALAHFVPDFWSAEHAYAILNVSLSRTAYDPSHPASQWTVDKFLPVLDGRRVIRDGWKAEFTPASVQEVVPPADAVDALLAEMLKPSEVIQRPAPRYLIQGLLNLDSESWVIGAAGSKKSFVVLDMAGHVAAGMPWQGRRVTKVKVVMIVAEGAGGLGPRLKAWQLENGQPLNDDDIRILPRPVQAANLAAWAVLIEACRRIGPGLVVLDTQARVTVGLEENSAKEMGVFTEAVRAIREATGACVLPVHHTGRTGGDARGSSAIDGAQHTELKVVRDEALIGRLISEKQKDMALAEDVPLVFAIHQTGVDENGEPVTSLALVKDAFRKLAGQTDAPQPEEEWVKASISAVEMVSRVLRDHGMDRGVTKAEARGIVIERFFGGDPKRLHKATWHTAWNRAVKDPSVIQVGGERFTVDPISDEAAKGTGTGSASEVTA